MWVIGKFVFLCLLVAPTIEAQFTPSLREPNAYITAVIDALWVKIKDHGISNLPVPDVTFVYNVNALAVELIGPVSFEDGFVQDITSVHPSPLHFASSASATQAQVSARIAFDGLRLYRDLRADLSTGLKLATCVITPTTFMYQLDIRKMHGNDTVVPTLAFASAATLTWDIDPDDLLTMMIRRQSIIPGSISGRAAVELVSTTLDAWLPLFRGFIQEIVKTIEFPELIF